MARIGRSERSCRCIALEMGAAGLRHRQHLTDRVAWMAEREDEPEAAVRALQGELEARGLWPLGLSLETETPADQVQELLADNPAWPDYMNLEIRIPTGPAVDAPEAEARGDSGRSGDDARGVDQPPCRRRP